jgi:hypothetical protein
MTTRIKLRRDTAANWTTANPILAAGEPGLESDTGKIKYGDGVTRWNALEHTGGDALTNLGDITVQTGDSDRWFIRLRKEDSNLNEMSGVIVISTNYDSEGNALVVAQIDINTDGIVVFKFTPAGELVWKKVVDGFSNNYWVDSYNAVVDSNDNLLFAVSTESNTGTIVKINGSTGAVVFSNSLDFGTGYDINAIGVDSTDNIIIGGRFYFSGPGYGTAFVAKLNPTATSIIWQHSLVVDSGESFILGLVVDFNDDIVVTGYADVTREVNGSSQTDNGMLVAKVASAGTLSWQKTVAIESDTPYGKGFNVSVDSIGNIYVTGTYYVANPEADNGPNPGDNSNAVVVFKMTALGVMVWDRRIGPGQCSWVGVNTAVGDDGDLYLYASTYEKNPLSQVQGDQAGYYTSRLILARYNKTTGAVIWQSYFDNPLAQEVPGYANAPWGGDTADLLSVRDGKILIGGSVRFGQSDVDLWTPWGNDTYFNQGFLAQFDTDATYFSADGWELKTSRIPGKLTNSLVATAGTLSWQDNDLTIGTAAGPGFEESDAPVSVRRSTSKTNTWTFGKDGTLTAPADSNIKLQQTQLGYINMYGIMNNSDESIWYNSVCHDAEGNTYTLGANYFYSGRGYIQKFSPEGELLWNRWLRSGNGADFYVEWSGNEYTYVSVNYGGSGYKVGDKIVLPGSAFGGSDGVNSLVLEVTGINNDTDYVGSVATVNIVSGVAVDGSSDASASDNYDDAECETVAIAFNPVTGNPMVLVTTPTYNGDTFDSEWTQTVILEVDSGSGTIIKSTTLADEGDIYAYDIAVSPTGKVAVVGEKYNEYNVYGNITPLTGSGINKLFVAKSDIDAEHYPGEPNGNWSDWYLYGTSITDQLQVQNVNYYPGLTGTTQQGSGAVFTIDDNGNGTYSALITTAGSNYKVGHKIKILGTSLGGTSPTNDITITVDAVDGSGGITSLSNSGTAAGGPTSYTGQSGSNYNTGSGAEFYLYFNSTNDGAIYNWGNTAGGQNYVVGDVITIAGTNFADGDGGNDVTITVTAADGGTGSVTGMGTPSGTHPSTAVCIRTYNNSIDFGAAETFAIKQSLGAEAFVWTPDFNKAIGGNNSDTFSGVTWDSTGANLYAVGHGRYDVTYDQGLVVKYSSTGTLLSSKFINNGTGDVNAYYGTVALMANDSIVVVHTMYNNTRDETDEILVTKLDSDLNMVWQQFIGFDSINDGWSSPSRPSVAVDPATDEILVSWSAYDDTELFNDDGIVVVKLDTDGQVLWKRMFGCHESDTVFNDYNNGTRALSIYGNKFTFVGASDAPGDDTNNAIIVTFPLDGSGTGLHNFWKYVELSDRQLQVMPLSSRTSENFSPNVHSDAITAVDNLKYYFTDYPWEEYSVYPTVIRNEEGGAIEFGDGSKQSFSAAVIPQVISGENRYTLRPEDTGRHILVESENYDLIIPNWQSTRLPVGYTVTIVNVSNNTINVYTESVNGGIQGKLWISGADTKTNRVGIDDNGSGQMVTLMKIREGQYTDDAENHGDIWMIAGADIYNND